MVTVRDWSDLNQYEYRFIGDELFDNVPEEILLKTSSQKVIATDLARLYVLQDALREGYKTVVWVDADFLIYKPSEFILPDMDYALGREVWVQNNKHGNLKAYKNIHNAFMMFRKNNSFLDFYADTALKLVSKNQGTIPPQFIGPKLLTALHNVAGLNVIETAGMLSPLVIKDIIHGNGPALDLFNKKSISPVAGANLCISSCDKNEVTAKDMKQLIEVLKSSCGH